MTDGVLEFWNALKGKVSELIKNDTKNCIRRGRFEVVTAPNGTKMGVRQAYGNTVNLPYSPSVAGASVGQSVYAQWSGSLSNGFIYAFGDGIEQSGTLTADVSTTWTTSGGISSQTVTVNGMKSSYDPIADVVLNGTNDDTKLNEWGKITRIVTANNSVTFYASSPTATAITVRFKIY